MGSDNFTADPLKAFVDDCKKEGLTVDGYDSRLQLNDTTPNMNKASR